ncbi:hypothetical protein ACLUV9_03015 [Limosilactobacillus balticus]|uniref:hypothetical protein n=1 Tax=Limosilactobacillus balticus TaxID=2759747 RepID=UPI003995E84F
METQRKEIQKQIKTLQQALVTIDAKINYYQKAERTHSLEACQDERSEFIQKLLNGELK